MVNLLSLFLDVGSNALRKRRRPVRVLGEGDDGAVAVAVAGEALGLVEQLRFLLEIEGELSGGGGSAAAVVDEPVRRGGGGGEGKAKVFRV